MLRDRVARVQSHMLKTGLEAMVVTSSDSFFYLTGKMVHPGERLMAMVLRHDQEPLIFLPQMFDIGSVPFETTYYVDTDHPLKALCQALSPYHVVGVDKEWPSHFLLSCMHELPKVTWQNGSPTVDQARLTKDHEERDLMRMASKINDLAMAELVKLLVEGVSEIEVKSQIDTIMRQLGATGTSFEPIVCFGAGAAEPHHTSDETLLKQGDGILIDMGCVYKGYASDMTRSFVLGHASSEYEQVHEAVLRANLAAISVVKPGTKLSDVDKAARQVLEEAGFGDYFIHRTGHGIGINVHEYPDVSGQSDQVCQPGMVFSIEPGAYLKNTLGVRIEDLVLVTETGHELLNHYPKKLIEL